MYRILGFVTITGLLTPACGTDPTSFRVGRNQIDAVTIGQGITLEVSWEPKDFTP